jgi:molybdate transport repressor ModE-like protein
VHFDLTDLRLFAAIVEEGSITVGASHVGISLPSASARMKGMEEMLGTALLERHRRGVRPTPAGHALFHHSQLVLAQMERLRGDLREHARGGVRGHIRLISNTTALEEYLPDVLAGWLATNPGVEGLQTFPFRIDRLVAIVPRGHALAKRRNIAFVDLLDEEFVGLVAGSALAEHLAWQSTRLGRPLKPRIRLRGLDAVCRMVASHVGIAVVPETAATRCRRTMAFSTLRLTDTWAVRQLIACIRRKEALPAHTRRLVEHLAGTAKTDL